MNRDFLQALRPFFIIGAALAAAVVMLCLAGCGTANTLAKGLSDKSISGSGTVAIQRVGVDDETKTPVLKSTIITGDYASARDGEYALQYRRRKSPSIFNANAVTEEVTINYIGTKKQAIEALELARKDVEQGAKRGAQGAGSESDMSDRSDKSDGAQDSPRK